MACEERQMIKLVDRMQKEILLLGKTIQVFLCRTDCGVQIVVTGGDKSHIGAVSIVDEQGHLISHVFEGHKDGVISDQWAVELHKKWKVPVVVSAGIHYDHITPSQINTVVETMTALLKEIGNKSYI